MILTILVLRMFSHWHVVKQYVVLSTLVDTPQGLFSYCGCCPLSILLGIPALIMEYHYNTVE
jgi:hypothetical protein